jgi:hypothetical protein
VVNKLDLPAMNNFISAPGLQAVMGEAGLRLERVSDALNRQVNLFP